MLGDYVSTSARYRVSQATLLAEFPDLPNSATGLNRIEQDNQATVQEVSLALNVHHPCGAFGEWESSWHHQHNAGYAPSLPDADFWQHQAMMGYRFPGRHAEIRLGFLNLFNQDYRLNPLNLQGALPRARMFVTSVRLNF